MIASLHIELNPNCEVNLPLPLPSNGGDNNNNTKNGSNGDSLIDEEQDQDQELELEEAPSQIDRKLFLAAVGQVREVYIFMVLIQLLYNLNF